MALNEQIEIRTDDLSKIQYKRDNAIVVNCNRRSENVVMREKERGKNLTIEKLTHLIL